MVNGCGRAGKWVGERMGRSAGHLAGEWVGRREIGGREGRWMYGSGGVWVAVRVAGWLCRWVCGCVGVRVVGWVTEWV